MQQVRERYITNYITKKVYSFTNLLPEFANNFFGILTRNGRSHEFYNDKISFVNNLSEHYAYHSRKCVNYNILQPTINTFETELENTVRTEIKTMEFQKKQNGEVNIYQITENVVLQFNNDNKIVMAIHNTISRHLPECEYHLYQRQIELLE